MHYDLVIKGLNCTEQSVCHCFVIHHGGGGAGDGHKIAQFRLKGPTPRKRVAVLCHLVKVV